MPFLLAEILLLYSFCLSASHVATKLEENIFFLEIYVSGRKLIFYFGSCCGRRVYIIRVPEDGKKEDAVRETHVHVKGRPVTPKLIFMSISQFFFKETKYLVIVHLYQIWDAFERYNGEAFTCFFPLEEIQQQTFPDSISK